MKSALSLVLSLSPLLASAGPVLNTRQNAGSTNQALAQSPEYNHKEDKFEMNLSSYCSEDKKRAVIHSIAEAGYLVNAMKEWGSNPAYDNGMRQFMGKGIDDNLRQRIQGNIQRQWDLHTNKIQTNVNIHCGDDNGIMQYRNCKEGVNAYTWDEDDVHQVVLCDSFFNNHPSLEERLAPINKNPSRAGDINQVYNNRGAIWFHETMHWGQTISQPRVVDYDPASGSEEGVYGPKGISDNAVAKGAASNSRISDAYTLVALSHILTKNFFVEDDLEVGNATSEAVDTVIHHSHTHNNRIVRRDPAERWSKVSASQASLDPTCYLPLDAPALPSCQNKQGCNAVSSCSPTNALVPVEDYKTVVRQFCDKVNDRWLDAEDKTFLSMALEAPLANGGQAAGNGQKGFLYFQIHNKQKTEAHHVEKDKCFEILTNDQFLKADGQCSGGNGNTKGGSFQLGNEAISYKVLAATTQPRSLQIGEPRLTSDPVFAARGEDPNRS